MIGLIHTAAVYTPNGTTGAYDVVAHAALPCRLTFAPSPSLPADERIERESLRRLLWGPSETVAENAQVLINGERWNTRPGSFAALAGPTGVTIYQRCDVVRAV